MTNVGQDLRYALRGLRQRPGFTLGVVLTLALGIGANATMFGVVDRLLFRPPAHLTDADRVHRIYLVRSRPGEPDFTARNMQYRRYKDLTNWNRSFEVTAAMSQASLAVGTGEDALEMRVAAVSAEFFQFFDVRPLHGRLFTRAEDSALAGTPVTVLSHELWRSRYGGRTDALGQTVKIGAQTYTIIGVMPPRFAGMWEQRPPVAWIPITAYAQAEFSAFGRPGDWANAYNITWLEMIARRKPGVAVADADADLSQAFQRSYAVHKEMSPGITNIDLARPRATAGALLSERGPRATPESKVAAWVSGVALIVLLIACANVANLLLARALHRRREVAVRLALGVSRGRLVRQLLTESLVLAALGGGAGLLIAQWGGTLLRTLFLPAEAPVAVFTDLRTLLFAAVVIAFVGVLTGLAPLAQTGRRMDLAAALKSGTRATYHRSRLRLGLLVFQATLSVVLLIGAGLFVRSLRNVSNLALGFDQDPVLWIGVEERGEHLPPAEKRALRERLHREAAALPEVASASRAVTVPFWMTWDEGLFVTGIDSVSRLGSFTLQAATPDYFTTMGTRILRGRGLLPTDRDSAPRVMVVSEAMGRALWPRKDPLGECVRIGADTAPCTTVVGVAQNIRTDDAFQDDRMQHYYVPIWQRAAGGGGLFVRVRGGDAVEAAEGVRRALQRHMPGSSYVTVRPMADIWGPTVRSWRIGATMFTAFGLLALVLAAVGLYSVIAYGVAQRTHELGVRVALGAGTPRLLWLVVSEGLRLSLAAVALGLITAAVLVRFVAPLLYETTPHDPLIFTAVGVTLVIVAAAASFVPALRAARVDPNVALRSE